jgi:hypothetical protein
MSDYTPYENDDNRPLSVTHLVFGLIFLGIAAMWLVAEVADIEAPVLSVSGPAILIGAGVIGLVASFVNNRRRAARNSNDHYEEY